MRGTIACTAAGRKATEGDAHRSAAGCFVDSDYNSYVSMDDKPHPVRVVVVTGSSGMLGHHVVRELHLDFPSVQEIRLFDTKPYKNGIGHAIHKKVNHVVGSVCDAQAVREAFRGADAVIHCAAIVPVKFVEDESAYEKVNVYGTQNVVDACVAESVPYLVLTGSAGVTTRGESSATKLAYESPYAESKARAETIVREASGRLLSDGQNRLRTLVVRLTPFYGELDYVYVPKLVRMAKRTFKTMFIPGSGFQVIYAGNAGSFHVRALDALSKDVTLSGSCFVATDDTPLDGAAMMRPLVEGHGIRIFPRPVPYPLALGAACCIRGVARVLAPVAPSLREARLPTRSDLRYVYSGLVFDGAEALQAFGWRPKYSHEEAVRMSRTFYDNL